MQELSYCCKVEQPGTRLIAEYGMREEDANWQGHRHLVIGWCRFPDEPQSCLQT